MEVIKEAQLRKGEANTVVGLSSPESVTVPSAAHGSSHGASIPHTAVLTPSHNPSPAHSRPSTSNEALHRLSKLASQSGDSYKQGVTAPGSIPSHIKVATKPLDFSELRHGSGGRPVLVLCPSPPPSPVLSPSVSPAPTPTSSASRCLPYKPKPRDRSRASLMSMSTPKKLFVRPFEDDYSPIVSSVDGELEVTGETSKLNSDQDVGLEDIVRLEEQEDSDYESMSSDSSIKKEGDKGLVCPTSGHVLTDEESEKKEPIVMFQEPGSDPGPDLPSQHKDKLNYLRYFRLVTHTKKNDIEIQKLEKRKLRLRERSPSPPPPEVGDDRPTSPCLPLPSVPPHLNRLPETHAKAMYLSAIGLCRNTEEQKTNHEVVWSAVLDDRLARDKETVINKYFYRLREMAHSGRGQKRTWGGTPVTQSVATSGLTPPSVLSTVRTHLNIPNCEAYCRLTESLEPRVSLPSSVEINLCTLQPIARPSLLLQEIKQETTKFSSYYSSSSHGSHISPPCAPPAHLQHLGFPRVVSPFSRMEVKQEPEDLSQPQKRRKPCSPPPWPGIEAVIESYRRWNIDGETEKTSLLERSSRAGAEVLARRCSVDNLSTRLSSLARLHKTLVGNQTHTLTILETLRGQLSSLANYQPVK